MKKIRYTPLQIAVHLYAWSALAGLVFEFLVGRHSPNIIQELEQRTGRHALTLLVLSLACTPLGNLAGWRELLKRRRTLGLYAFMYASIHVMIFVNLDYGLAWSFLIQTVLEKPYILFGMTAFLLLAPLAITSFDIWKVRLGRNWRRLHRLIYFAAPIAVLHFALSKKGDIFHLQGDIVRPLIYGLVLAVLLIMRIPLVRRALASLSTRIRILFSRLGPQPKMDPDRGARRPLLENPFKEQEQPDDRQRDPDDRADHGETEDDPGEHENQAQDHRHQPSRQPDDGRQQLPQGRERPQVPRQMMFMNGAHANLLYQTIRENHRKGALARDIRRRLAA